MSCGDLRTCCEKAPQAAVVDSELVEGLIETDVVVMFKVPGAEPEGEGEEGVDAEQVDIDAAAAGIDGDAAVPSKSFKSEKSEKSEKDDSSKSLLKRKASQSRLTMRGAPSLFFCLVMILTGMFYAFHHKKLHERGGGSYILSRLEREFTNLGILAALMMAVVFTQVFVMYDMKELYFVNVKVDGMREVSWQFTLNFAVLIVAAIGEVLALIFSIINLVTLNLVAPDELILYLQHATWTVRLPILMLIYGTVTWVVNVLVAVFYLSDFKTGLIFNIIIILCAIFVFYTWCVMLQSTYIASQHAELVAAGIQELPTLPGFFTPGDSATHLEEVQQRVKELQESPVEEMPHLHEQKLVKRLSKTNLELADRYWFSIASR